MEEKTRRIYVSVDAELEKRLDQLKKTEYYAKPHSEMLRDLIELGLQQKNGSLREKIEKN